jgi:hypothetical protein
MVMVPRVSSLRACFYSEAVLGGKKLSSRTSISRRRGQGAGAWRAAALRAGRRKEGGGAGETTNVLARTASGDVQPSA